MYKALMNTSFALSAGTAALMLVLLSGCTTSYTFEVEPMDGDMKGNYDTGWEGNPKSVNCVQIEADGPTDEEDVQMGTYCKDSR